MLQGNFLQRYRARDYEKCAFCLESSLVHFHEANLHTDLQLSIGQICGGNCNGRVGTGCFAAEFEEHDDHDRRFPPDYLYACHSEDFLTSSESGQRGSAFTRGLDPVVAVVPVANTEVYVVTRDTPTEKERKKGSLLERFTGKRKGFKTNIYNNVAVISLL